MLNFNLIGTVRLFCVVGVLASSVASAAEIKVEGVHLCCGSCVKSANKALADIEGVSKVNIAKDDELITFQAADDAAAQRGLQALADSGFYGKPSVPGPDFKIAADRTADEIQISKMHLCCGGCVDAAKSAVTDIAGVASVTAQAKQGKITIKGEKINVAAILKALHETGMHGKIE